jgi:protein SCO1/2
MKKGGALKLGILLVFILPVTAYALLNIYEKKLKKLPVLGTIGVIADFSFTNQDGKMVRPDKWKNKIVVVDFFFSHCTSICPKMTSNMKKIYGSFTNDKEIQFASFSVDPERDSAAQLHGYAQRWEINTANWDLLTGDKRDIYRLARNSFRIVATDGDGGPNDFIHSDKLVLVDKKARIRGYYDGTSDTEISQLLQDLKKLKYED